MLLPSTHVPLALHTSAAYLVVPEQYAAPHIVPGD